MVFRKGRVPPAYERDDASRSQPTGEKEWIPLPVMQVYVHQVANAKTMRELDAVMLEATTRYLSEGLRELMTAISARRRQLDPQGERMPAPGLGPAPAPLVELWVKRVADMPREVLDSFERRTLTAWEAASLAPLEAAILARRRELDTTFPP